MYGTERSLVKKYKNKPFVLIGVNSDEPERLRDIIKQRDLTWDSWADGRGGPIASKYLVHAFPTIYIIDDKGIIRAKNVRGPELETTIDELVSKVGRN
jgi:peroxiredoxin